jgi:hypothetical protein
MLISAGLISQLFAWIAGITTSALLIWSLGIHKSLNFLSPMLKSEGEDSKSETEVSKSPAETSEAALFLANKVLSGSGSNGASGESSEDCIN